MVYIPNRIEEDFFSGHSVEEIEGDYDLDETNININLPLSVCGVTELTGNINIQSGIKSKDDIILSGDVQNSSNTVIYSQYGNIEIDCNNVNLNGLIYAPFGNVHIKASNLNMNNTRPMEIVAKIMRNYYSYARVNTPENYASNVITYKGHKYSVINGTGISWSAAEATCEAMGGHLMYNTQRINSFNEGGLPPVALRNSKQRSHHAA